MTIRELNKIFKNVKIVFCRAGADTINEDTPRKAKAYIKELIEFGEEINDTFTKIGDILYIDSPSWIEYHKED